jgi:hypothetical protein
MELLAREIYARVGNHFPKIEVEPGFRFLFSIHKVKTEK